MRTVLTAFGLSVLLLACNEAGDNASTTETSEPAAPPASMLNEEGTQKLLSTLDAYYKLKDGLVATKGEDASIAAEALARAVSDLQMFVVNDSVTNATVRANLDTINRMSLKISQTNPSEVETMRLDFEKVSDNMFAALKTLKLTNGGVYQQYCPMAFDDKGAYWLSNESAIRNPYFGKKMLTCGEVTDSL